MVQPYQDTTYKINDRCYRLTLGFVFETNYVLLIFKAHLLIFHKILTDQLFNGYLEKSGGNGGFAYW